MAHVIHSVVLRLARLALALAITAAIVLVAIEWGVQTMMERPRRRSERTLERLSGTPFDRRRTVEIVRDLRAAGTPAVPSIVPKVVIEHSLPESDPAARYGGAALPLSGISHRPTVQLCNETGTAPVYRSDRYGFSNPDSVWDLTPATLLLIGDSFTHGYCVADEDSTLAARLRQGYPRTINLGTGGSGPLSELATLTEYQPVARPEVVLWFYHENDFRDLAIERRHATMMRYLEPGFSQRLPQRQAEIDAALLPWVDSLYTRGFASEDVGGLRLRRLLTLFTVRTLIASIGRRSDEADQQALFRQIMQTASQRAAAGGSRLVFVFLPRWERWFQPRSAEVDLRDSVLAAVAPLGIQVIDLTTVIDSVADKAALFARRDLLRAHYSPRGYQLVADVVQDRLDPPIRPSAHPLSSKSPR